MRKIARFIVSKRIPILVIGLILAVACGVMTFFVNINYDMTTYLPKEFKTSKAIAIMNEEFGDVTDISVVFKGIDSETADKIYAELMQTDGVSAVQYDASSDSYVKDGYTRYAVVVGYNTYSEEALDVINAIRDKYADYDLYVSGAAVENETSDKTLTIAIAVAFAILMAILFIASSSWFDPVIYLINIGIAVIINMGTNIFFESISSLTNSIAAILQLVLSMDYSIMLMNRFRRELCNGADKETALINALTGGASSILSSAVTTIVGLLCLVFMNFTIGVDMGVVLAKGVIISLICVFTVLPGLIILFDKPLLKGLKKRSKYSKTLKHEIAAEV